MRPTTRSTTTSYGNPPGTSMRGPGSRAGLTTGMNRPPGTARLSTGLTSSLGRQAAQGIALQQGINITDRPTTTQGMKGMTSKGGTGRLVQDSTFYIGVLRNKVNEITEELEKLQKEISQHTKEEAHSMKMQRKVEELDKEVRTLEGTLADYNIAMDKMRQGTDVSELDVYIRDYEAKNRAFAQEIDEIFIMKQQEESACQSVEQQIETAYQANQEKINSMEPGRLQQYQELVQANMNLQEQATHLQGQIDAAADQTANLKAQRDANTFNQEFRELEQHGLKVQKQLQSLVEELEISKLDPAEMQKQMLAKVKAINARSSALDDQIKQMREENRKSEQHLAELTTDLTDRNNGGSGETDKYEKLYQKDREMTEFIESFEETQNRIVEEQKQAQQNIVALLEHISRGIESESNMPSREGLKEMNEEASFKARQLESSQITMARLMEERTMRLAEHEKIKNLDEKVRMELGTLETKMDKMSEEMGAFDDLEDLRRRAADTKDYLKGQLESYQKRTRATREQVASLNRKHESLRKKLEGNKMHERLQGIEKRLRMQAQTIFTLQEFVDTKMRQTDFEGIKHDCMTVSGQLNNMIKEGMTHHAQNLSEAPLSMSTAVQW